MKKIILPDLNIAVIEDDSHLTPWIKQAKRLDHDPNIQTLANFILPGTVVIDAGASIGDHTIAYCRKAKRVYAFEPNPVAFACLQHNCPGADKWNMALGAEEAELWWVEAKPNYGASFLVSKYQEGAFRVPVEKLDWFCFGDEKISFIKVDVEGWETQFLLGAEKTIREHRPNMTLEVNKGALERAGTSTTQLLDLIRSFGYSLQPVPGTNEHPLQWDVLATPEK